MKKNKPLKWKPLYIRGYEEPWGGVDNVVAWECEDFFMESGDWSGDWYLCKGPVFIGVFNTDKEAKKSAQACADREYEEYLESIKNDG